MSPTREQLIDLCRRGSVPQTEWRNRDSAKAQMQLGEALMLLRAGCDFEVLSEGDLKSDKDTWWVRIKYEGFAYFEDGDYSTDLAYIPTEARLTKTAGGDWYL